MSYIKNKLDEFRKLTIELRREHFTIDTGGDGIVEVLPNLEKQAKYNDGIEKFIEQALTDYHNHIVEKIQNYEYEDLDKNELSWIMKDDILKLLQDNPASQDKE
jgi:hypothetical protein